MRAARAARSLSLRTLAGQLGVSPGTLSAIETGRTPLTVERLHALAALLDVPATTLLRGGTPSVTAAATTSGAADWRDFSDIPTTGILEAAITVFVRLGFHAASMRTVAEQAGMSVGGIYHHYRSKQDLLEEILTLTLTQIRWRIDAARDQADSPVAAYANMVEALALFHAVRGDLAFLGASEMRGLTEPARARIVLMRNDVQYALDEQAQRCLEAGEFTCPDPHTVGRAITTMCTALPTWYDPHGPLPPAHIAQRYAQLALTLMGSSAPDPT